MEPALRDLQAVLSIVQLLPFDQLLAVVRAALSVARLLPLEQRLEVVKEVLTLLDDVDPERARRAGLTLAGWQAAAADAVAKLNAKG